MHFYHYLRTTSTSAAGQNNFGYKFFTKKNDKKNWIFFFLKKNEKNLKGGEGGDEKWSSIANVGCVTNQNGSSSGGVTL